MLYEKNEISQMETDKKLPEYVSMATKKGYLYNIFGGLNWQISIQIISLQQRWD